MTLGSHSSWKGADGVISMGRWQWQWIMSGIICKFPIRWWWVSYLWLVHMPHIDISHLYIKYIYLFVCLFVLLRWDLTNRGVDGGVIGTLGTLAPPRHWGAMNEPCVVASMVHPDRWSIKAHPRALVVLGGGGGVCHQGGVGPCASCLISGSPALGSCRTRWLGGLGG